MKIYIITNNEKPLKTVVKKGFSVRAGGEARTHEACSAGRRESRPPEPLRKLRQAHLLHDPASREYKPYAKHVYLPRDFKPGDMSISENTVTVPIVTP